MKITKANFLLALILFSLALAACRQEATTSQNMPVVSATATPGSSIINGSNPANADNAPEKTANQAVKPAPTVSAVPRASVSPTAAPIVSNGAIYKNYNGVGVIKKIDVENSSVTIDHEDIGDYMVGMEMPFPVVNKNILKNLKVGDKVSFVLETGVGVERIVSIRKN